MASVSITSKTSDLIFAPARNVVPRYNFEQEPTIEHDGKDEPLHGAQVEVWEAMERIISACAGTQSGKTCIGPWWVLRELQRAGGGDFLVVGPTYPLMDRKLVPECITIWQHQLGMGEYKRGYRIFEFNQKGLAMLGVKQAKVYFAFAEDPESLESMTAVGCWRDETGQKKFSREAKEAINRRLSLATKRGFGRTLETSTPYFWGWWKYDIHDKAHLRVYFDDYGRHEEVRPGEDEMIRVVSYRSIDNPSFPIEEWERQQRLMPEWRFRMMYCGEFTKPAGVVYDCFDAKNVCKRFEIPPEWRRYAGHDFGPVHTAGVWLAQDPESKVYYLYAQYQDGGKAVEDHASTFHTKADGKLEGSWGGTWSEDTWRNDFSLRGYPINRPAIKDLKEGIQRVYAMLKDKKLVVFDDLPIIQDFREYSYELDDMDQVMEDRIESKNSWHCLDACRYAMIALYAMQMGGVKVHRRMK